MYYEIDKLNNDSAFKFSESVVNVITDLSEPFLSNFGLNTFIYGRIFYDGRYVFFTNNIDWAKNWYQNIYTIENTSLHGFLQNVPLGEKPGYHLWSSISHADKIEQAHHRFGLWYGFDIHYRLTDSIEGWSFSTNSMNQWKNQNKLNDFYLNNINIFHRFQLYFKEKLGSVIEIKDRNKIANFKEISDINFKSFLPIEEKEMKDFFSSYLKKGYSIPTLYGKIHLSKRELECLLCFSQGKTAKEIGRSLNISPRTVETYLLNIKQKTGYYNVSNLVDTLWSNVLKWL